MVPYGPPSSSSGSLSLLIVTPPSAGHVFMREPLVTVDGKDVSGWGWKFHDQMRYGYDCAENVEGW